MKTKTLAIAAIALWGISAAFVGYKFVTGTTITLEDGREAVVLEAAERNFVLGEMRGMLEGVRDIIAAVNAGSMDDVQHIALRLGMAEVAAAPPQIMLKLPLAFKEMGMATHEGFDEVAAAAEQGSQVVLEKLEQNLYRCVACHESYQLTKRE